MNEESQNQERMGAPDDIDLPDLRKLCSRLAGDALCRCGGNMNGRYCLWSYYRMMPSSAGSGQKFGRRKDGKG